MDFIERIFGVSPDGGSGTLEALWLAAPFAALATALWIRRQALRRKNPRR